MAEANPAPSPSSTDEDAHLSVEAAIAETTEAPQEALTTAVGREMYAVLAAPFEYHHSDVRGGVKLTYITGEQAITRANAALGVDGWTFKVLEHGIHAEADEVWVLAEVTTLIGERVVSRQQFGSQKIKRSRATNVPLDIGFDLKGAATDAMKKCLMAFGVGLYLSHKESEDERRDRATQARQAEFDARRPPPAGANGPVPTTRDEKAAAQAALERERATPAMPVCSLPTCGEMIKPVRSTATNRVLTAQEVVERSLKETGKVYCGLHLAEELARRAKSAASARAAYAGKEGEDDDVPF